MLYVMDSIRLGNEIKQRRLALNLRMEDVAKAAGITRSTLWSLEKGTSNCGIQSVLRVLEVLGLSLDIKNNASAERRRATRRNLLLDKKINRFVVMCIEQYAKHANKPSQEIYEEMRGAGIIDDLETDYEDLHGMSTAYLNDYFDALIEGGAA